MTFRCDICNKKEMTTWEEKEQHRMLNHSYAFPKPKKSFHPKKSMVKSKGPGNPPHANSKANNKANKKSGNKSSNKTEAKEKEAGGKAKEKEAGGKVKKGKFQQ